ncbi:hypothetical protein Tco_0867396 [Tanacetum coccineum]
MPTHPMVTRAKAGIFKPLERMNCHVTTTLPLPRSHVHALHDPNWKEAMLDEYNALITNGIWFVEQVTSKIVFWIDPEFHNGCYKNLIIELYLALNPDERYEYMEQIKVQENLEILQVQYDFYQAQMESKLNESENSATFWKKMVVVFVVLFVIVKLL